MKPQKSKTHKSAQQKNTTKPYFYGIHAVKALLDYRPQDALSVFIQPLDNNKNLDEIVTLAQSLGVSVQTAHKDKITELCGTPQHQGVAVLSRPPKLADEALLERLSQKIDALFLVLDQITDAHNLGACLRSACAMGVDAVIIPKHQSATITPSVAKVSVGASEIVPVVPVSNLARSLVQLKKAGVFVFGTALDDTATPSDACDFLGKVAIVMGSEGDGIRRLTSELCDTLTYIPMSDGDRPQSLNVSVATGMMLYEVSRQRAQQRRLG